MVFFQLFVLHLSSKSIWFRVVSQELRSREEDLNRAQMKQRLHEEQLRQKEQELHAREMHILERELKIMITQQQAPTPKKRKGS